MTIQDIIEYTKQLDPFELYDFIKAMNESGWIIHRTNDLCKLEKPRQDMSDEEFKDWQIWCDCCDSCAKCDYYVPESGCKNYKKCYKGDGNLW